MSNEDDKFQEEKRYFISFATASGLDVDISSIEKLSPPKKPDIRCLIDGKVSYFEMARMCSQDLARLTSKFKEDVIWLDDPVARTITGKFECLYEVDGEIDLVLYDVGLIALPPDVVVPKLKHEIKTQSNKTFRQIWYFAEGMACRVK